MEAYWFRTWLKEHRVKNERSLEKALSRASVLDSLLSSAPEPTFSVRDEPSELVELTGGKGIDLTGELGCHHIDCLQKEVDGLFRHAWHYFDRITLPDQALFRVLEFERHKDVAHLIQRLSPFVLVLQLMERDGVHRLVKFESRTPSCLQHFQEHAREAKSIRLSQTPHPYHLRSQTRQKFPGVTAKTKAMRISISDWITLDLNILNGEVSARSTRKSRRMKQGSVKPSRLPLFRSILLK